MKILTLTLSPAVDIEYAVGSVELGKTSRAKSHSVSAGGKGINVSRCILNCIKNSHINTENNKISLITIAPLGGYTGRMFSDILSGEGIEVTTVPIKDNTRVNISVIPIAGDEVEVNAPGTPVGEALPDLEKLVLDSICPGDVLIIAGSCPSDVKKSYPAELCKKAKDRGGLVVLDCDGDALRTAVTGETPPDLIKPNRDELSALVGRELSTDSDVVAAAESLDGKISVITTMAGDGAYYTDFSENGRGSKFYPTEKRKVVRLKGAGDTFLGAFVYARFGVKMNISDAMAYASEVAGDYVAGE